MTDVSSQSQWFRFWRDLRVPRLILVEAERARVVPAAHALHAQQLLVRLAADRQRHEVVTARDHGCLRAPSTEAAEPATSTSLLAGRPQELLELLRPAGECIERIRGIVARTRAAGSGFA